MPLTLTTKPVSSITPTTASSGGLNIVGTGTITAKGVCWSTVANPTVSLVTKTNDIATYPGTSVFDSALTGLTPGLTYYVRAYITDGSTTYYGANVVFTTPGLSTVDPDVATPVIGQTTATSGATSVNGFTNITAVGVCWNTTINPTTANNHTVDVLTGNSFVSYITGLQSGTLYYVRAYVVSGGVTYYGVNQTFTTVTSKPIVTTTVATSVTATTANPNGNVVNLGGSSLSITKRGVCYSLSSTGIDVNVNPSGFATQVSQTGTYSTGVFTSLSSITGLTPGTTYYYRAYAINSDNKFAYGEQYNFTTLGGPTVETVTPYSETNNSVVSGCNIISTGGSAITARGVVLSTAPNPTLATGIVLYDTYYGNGTLFLTKILNLTADTTYYLRGFATNAQGTQYGEEKIFSTLICETDCCEEETTVQCSDIVCEAVGDAECAKYLNESLTCTTLTNYPSLTTTSPLIENEDDVPTSLGKINDTLCHLFSKESIKEKLNIINNTGYIKQQFCNIVCNTCHKSCDFVSEWTVSSILTIALPYLSSGTYSGTIDWGDGNTSVNTYANRNHTYAAPGTYTITISGVCKGWNFSVVPATKDAIQKVLNWGCLRLIDVPTGGYFQACTNLELDQVNDTLNLTGIKILTNAFARCLAFTTINNVEYWDVSKVFDFTACFSQCPLLNDDFNSWDMSAAESLDSMFYQCSALDQTFKDWKFTSELTSMQFIFNNSGLSTANYTSTIVGWANKALINSEPLNVDMTGQTGMTFTNALPGYLAFADAQAARDYLVNTCGWTISGDTII